ncbi:MAG: hypothetical protein VXZ65_03125, partial [Candidatus Thermoplasmatota archaeon]|nr:hypothetical protein [Candidatus Thermoplasmatota archaeon]
QPLSSMSSRFEYEQLCDEDDPTRTQTEYLLADYGDGVMAMMMMVMLMMIMIIMMIMITMRYNRKHG